MPDGVDYTMIRDFPIHYLSETKWWEYLEDQAEIVWKISEAPLREVGVLNRSVEFTHRTGVLLKI